MGVNRYLRLSLKPVYGVIKPGPMQDETLPIRINSFLTDSDLCCSNLNEKHLNAIPKNNEAYILYDSNNRSSYHST